MVQDATSSFAMPFFEIRFLASSLTMFKSNTSQPAGKCNGGKMWLQPEEREQKNQRKSNP